MRAILFLFLAFLPQRVEFEVATVKLGDPLDPESSARTSSGRLEMKNTTLNNLVRSAYRLNEYQLEGGPKWANETKFHVLAKLPEGAPISQTPEMLQALLADRFQLTFHRVTKTLSEYQLVVDKGGPKLTPTDAAEGDRVSSSQGDRMLRGKNLTIAALARMLIGTVGAPVIDKTGLSGKYIIDLKFKPVLDAARESDNSLPTIFAALQETLGLKLESMKGPVEVLVIDKAELPTEN